MAETPPTLCVPDKEKSCFACCPPIRPPGYEHQRYTNEIRRVLRENTATFRREARSLSPITGFSCWALGYLDGGFRRIGCLLHPSQHDGRDLRYRVDFGDKCARESCVEARVFKALSQEARTFWVCLSEGLNSFTYSSRTLNPLFRVLGWGSTLLNLVAEAERGLKRSGTSILEAYPFFETSLSPRANAYFLRSLIDPGNVYLLKDVRFRRNLEAWSHRLSAHLSLEARNRSSGPYVHSLPVDSDFLDFLRLSARLLRTGEDEVFSLKALVDHELAEFRSRFL